MSCTPVLPLAMPPSVRAARRQASSSPTDRGHGLRIDVEVDNRDQGRGRRCVGDRGRRRRCRRDGASRAHWRRWRPMVALGRQIPFNLILSKLCSVLRWSREGQRRPANINRDFSRSPPPRMEDGRRSSWLQPAWWSSWSPVPARSNRGGALSWSSSFGVALDRERAR
jgi:hypothetical protein